MNRLVDAEPSGKVSRVWDSNLWLLVALLFSLAMLPLLETVVSGSVLIRAGFTVVVVIALLKRWSKELIRWIILTLAVVVIPFSWITLFVESDVLFVSYFGLGSVLLWFIGSAHLIDTVRCRRASFHSIFAAVSAYLLYGMAWAMSYWGIDSVARDALVYAHETADQPMAEFSRFVYFSFVTMTTLGYGDLTPTRPITQTLVWFQAVMGQFYVAVVIAWLVGALPRRDEDSGALREP